MTNHVRVTVVILTTLAALGCEGGPAPDAAGVTGQVTLNGVPVAVGSIGFIPQSDVDGPSGGEKIEDGKFDVSRMQDLRPGEYRVEITVLPQRPPELSDLSTPQSPNARNPNLEKWVKANPNRIFKDPTQTTVLKAGANTYNIDLK